MPEVDFKFTKNDPVNERLNTIYDSLVASIVGESISEEHIHDVRTTIKRLRSLWRLVRPVVAPETFDRNNQRLRNAAHGLAPLRDPLVNIEQLEALVKSASKNARVSCAHALEIVAAANAIHQPPAGFAHDRLKRVLNAMRESQRNFSKLTLNHDEWVLIGPGLQRIYRTARNRMDTAEKSDADQDFHDWRKAAKYYMYHVELIAFTWTSRLDEDATRLKDLEQALGEDHDLTMLAVRLKKLRSKIGRDEVADAPNEIEGRKKALRQNALKEGAILFAPKPRKLSAKFERRWRKARG